jgi:hypothetical protein
MLPTLILPSPENLQYLFPMNPLEHNTQDQNCGGASQEPSLEAKTPASASARQAMSIQEKRRRHALAKQEIRQREAALADLVGDAELEMDQHYTAELRRL